MARLVLETLLIGILVFLGALGYYLCCVQEGAAPVGPAGGVAESISMTEDAEHFLTHDGRPRRFVVHFPRGRGRAEPLPVVLSFHGLGGHAEAQRTLTGLSAAADKHGFLVVYPEGTGAGRWLSFNAGHCCGYALEHSIDDVGFIRRLLAELPRHYPVDPRRIYATGMSNGAMFCHRLARELSDQIAAIATVAGVMDMAGETPARPVPVLHFHGQKDRFAPFAGGPGPFGKVQMYSVREMIAWWVRVNHCQEDPVEMITAADFVHTRFAPPPGVAGAPVVLYVFPDGGHTWPGGMDLTRHLGTGRVIDAVNASTLLWQFFEAHTLP